MTRRRWNAQMWGSRARPCVPPSIRTTPGGSSGCSWSVWMAWMPRPSSEWTRLPRPRTSVCGSLFGMGVRESMSVLDRFFLAVGFDLFDWDHFIADENAVHQAMFLEAGNQHRQVHVENAEGDKDIHQEEVNQAQSLDVDQARNPADQDQQEGVVGEPLVHDQASDAFDRDQSVQPDIGKRRHMVVADFRDRLRADEEIKLGHVPHFLEVGLFEGNVLPPALPLIAAEEQVKTEQQQGEEEHSEHFVDEAEPSHEERPVGETVDERVMDVVTGDGEGPDGDHDAPMDEAQRILPDVRSE